MAKYFKGRIILPSDVNYDSQKINLGYLWSHYGGFHNSFSFNDSKIYPQGTEDCVLDYLASAKRETNKFYSCENPKILEIFKPIFDIMIKKTFQEAKSQVDQDVIFELLKDKNGNFYGKEVFTNRIFPLFDYQKNLNSCYKLFIPSGINTDYKLISSNSLDFSNMLEVKSMVTLDSYVNPNVVLKYKEDLKEKEVLETNQEIEPFELIQVEEDIAEVSFKFYQFISKIKHKKIIKEQKTRLEQKRRAEVDKRRNEIESKKKIEEGKKVFKQKIHDLADMNTFKEDFEFANTQIREFLEISENKTLFTDREQPSVEIILMDKIELSLNTLKQIDEKLYKNYLENYRSLIKNNNLSKFSLTTLLGDIDIHTIIGKTKALDVLESLDNLKSEYIENLLTDNLENNTFTFFNLNRIHEFVLKNKNSYEILSLRKIMKNLSLLYIIEVYSQKVTITLEELENSYFADTLQTIVLILKAMKEAGIIEYNQIFDLEDLSCQSVFEMIKSMEVKQNSKEEVSEFIKSL